MSDNYEEEDMVSVSERHSQIMEDGKSAARMLGYSLMIFIAVLIGVCLWFAQIIIEAMK